MSKESIIIDINEKVKGANLANSVTPNIIGDILIATLNEIPVLSEPPVGEPIVLDRIQLDKSTLKIEDNTLKYDGGDIQFNAGSSSNFHMSPRGVSWTSYQSPMDFSANQGGFNFSPGGSDFVIGDISILKVNKIQNISGEGNLDLYSPNNVFMVGDADVSMMTSLNSGFWTQNGGQQSILNSFDGLSIINTTSDITFSNGGNYVFNVDGTTDKNVMLDSGVLGNSGLQLNSLPATSGGTSGTLGTTPLYTNSVVVDSNGNTFSVAGSSATITKITPAGVVSTFASISAWASSIVIDDQNNLFVGCSNNVIQKITPAGVVSTITTMASQPLPLIIDKSNNIFLGRISSQTITKITPAGVVSTYATMTAGSAFGLAFDKLGNLFASNSIDEVYKFNSSGTLIATYSVTGTPRGIAIDSNNNAFISSYTINKVTKITPAGVVSIFNTNISEANYLLITENDDIYVPNSGANNVGKITSAGTYSIVASTPSGPSRLFYFNNAIYVPCNSGSAVYKINFPVTRDILSVDNSGKVGVSSNIYTLPSGLVVAPNSTNSLINTNNQAVLTKNYLDTKISKTAPTSSTDPGTAGDIRVADGFIYWYVLGTGWLRSTGTTF